MLQPLCISTSLPFPLPPSAAPPCNALSSVATYWCPFFPLDRLTQSALTPTLSLLFYRAASWAICFPGCVFSHLRSGLGFFPGWVAPFWNQVGVLYAWWDAHGILPVAQPWKPPTLPGQQPQDHRPITWPHFKPWFPPAPFKCQLVLLVTHPRGFYKGQVSGLSQEEKHP